MILHYLKIAARNLMKYKVQSAISIFGLAVGFVCFALSAMWIEYEMTYDSGSPDGDRMYILYRKDVFRDTGYSTFTSYPVSTLLKETFPEVEYACGFQRWPGGELEHEEGKKIKTPNLLADSCFMNMFDIKVLQGSMDFMYDDSKVALTRSTAIELFGTDDVLGRKVKSGSDEGTVCAILADLEHSNFSFGFWNRGAYHHKWLTDWTNGVYNAVIKLRKGVDYKEFEKKMQAFKKSLGNGMVTDLDKYSLMPVTKYHYADFNAEKSINFTYLVFFAVIGGLVILSSLFNYLSLFVNRMQMRIREIELRKVCGSTIGGLLAMFSLEYLLVILWAGFFGMMFIELTLPVFREMSLVEGDVYGKAGVYFAGILLLSFLTLCPFVLIRHKATGKGQRHLFRRISIAGQLIVTILFTFCMAVLFKQIYFLRTTDLGWERHNIAAFRLFYPRNNMEAVAKKLEQMPMVREVMFNHLNLLPKGSAMSAGINNWEGKQDSTEAITFEIIAESETFADFWGLQLLEGEMIKADNKDHLVVNESAVRAMGMTDPVGKKIYYREENGMTIAGVVKDFHTTSPTTPVTPTLLVGEEGSNFRIWGGSLIAKYHPGQWEELRDAVDELMTKEHPEVRYLFINVEDVYNEFLKSENTLLKLLTSVALVCLLISAFGIFSLVTLTCKQRQKEIAIRKINGATVRDILAIFAREHLVLLSLSALVAFPVGYALMKVWLQTYVEQTEISAWIFIGIYAGVAAVIALTIGWRVWRTANENPADVIKRE